MGVRSVQYIDDETSSLTLDNGEVIQLRYLDDEIEIYAMNPSEEKIGALSFRAIEFGDEDEADCYYKLTHAFIEGRQGRFLRQGIGTEAVKFFHECSGCSIELPTNDGLKHSDGNHMTTQGLAFVEHLKRLNAMTGLTLGIFGRS